MVFRESRLRHDDSTITRAPDLVRWGPVIAAVIIGLGFFALLNALWFAIAHGSGSGWFSGSLAWVVGGTAATSLLVADVLAGALAGVRGPLAGLVNGVAAWALLFILSVTALVPGAASVTSMLGSELQQGAPPAAGGGITMASALWTTFWSLLVGLVLAALGGILGGRIRRPVVLPEQRSSDDDGERPSAAAPVDEDGVASHQQEVAEIPNTARLPRR